MTDLIKSVKQFTEAVGCTTDQFNVRQTSLYIGLQLEEMAEKLDAIFKADLLLMRELRELSSNFKNELYDHIVKKADRSGMLDADIDLAWVTIGSAFSQGADVEGAAGEVAKANLSKLVNCCCIIQFDDGPSADINCEACKGSGLVAIKDENGKVKKPEGWTAPHIAPFVCKE